jgi:asparagine synthase (glutamine-hydrolysing)
MCRIYGYFGGEAIDRSALHQVGRAMVYGGPDAQTLWTGDSCALGSNRLAIQGIADGGQPFLRGELACVFNGEIYNHAELRAELARQGARFDGECDGNVILPLYERYGDDFISRLEGMFAIAIVDRRDEPSLRLYNDPFGMKSLYYYLSREGTRLAFSSELKPLSLLPDFPDEIDPLAVDRYLGGKAVWGPGTIYKNVMTMAPGTVLRFARSGLAVRHAEAVPEPVDWPGGGASLNAAADLLDEVLQRELERMLDADVPVCVITSGGVDSSYITALARKHVGDLASFNIAYKGDWPGDERAFADEVAAHCGTTHHQVLADPGSFPELIERFVSHLDQPNHAPHSLSTFALFEAIHEAGFKVALTGDGADELFSGYARYVKASRDRSATWHRRYAGTMAVSATDLLARMYTPAFGAEVSRAGGYFADRSGDEVARLVRETTQDKLDALLHYDQYKRFPYYILRRVDHLSMAHSVEARIPFLQPRVAALAHALPAPLKVIEETVKAPIMQAAGKWLPPSIIKRRKQPFTLPIVAMIRPGEALYDLVGDVLLYSGRRCAGLIRQDVIDDLFQLQRRNPADYAADALWSLLILELWLADRGLTF